MAKYILCLFWFLVLQSFYNLPVKASTFTATQNLSFGTLAPIASSGSVSIATNGSLSTNGVVTIINSGTTYYPGLLKFIATGLTGVLGEVVGLSFLSSSVTLNNTTGSGTVTVNNFATDPDIYVTLLNPSISNIQVIGTLNFTSSSGPGVYTGSVSVRAIGLLTGTSDATLNITVTLWQQLSLSEVTPLSFGVIELIGGAASVNVDAQTGARSIVSGASNIVLSNAAPVSSRGIFSITGQKNASINITLPSSITVSRSGGGSMDITNVQSYPASPATLNNGGNLTLYVGGTLGILAGQQSGTYNGTYNLTVNY